MAPQEESIPTEETGWSDDYEYLWICSTCHELVDRDRPDRREQQCRCQPNPDALPIEGDFSQRGILCRCCATEALPSGSRWLVHSCRECQLLATGVSVWYGRVIFPTGIHTIVNNFLPDTRPSTLHPNGGDQDTLVEDVWKGLKKIVSGTEFLAGWSAVIVAENLKRLGLSGDVRLKDYLIAVEREQMNSLRYRIYAFDHMCKAYRASQQ